MNNIVIKKLKGKREVGPGKPVFIIAEMSGNHSQSYERALKIIDAAVEAGVDAIKLQTFTADTITLDCDNKYFQINDGGLWDGKNLYKHYDKTCTPWGWQPKLKAYAEKQGLIFFSSPFDATAVDFLEKMKIEIYKVASLEVVDVPLLERIGKTKKPVIMSRGTSNVEEIKLAIKTLKKNGCPQVAVLQCVSSYPAKPENMNLKTIPNLAKRFGVVSGLSDHGLGNEVSIAAVALGASIVEKHITLSRKDNDVDGPFSLEPDEFKGLVQDIRTVEKALGRPAYGVGASETVAVTYRKSLFVVEDIKKGEKLTYRKNVRSIRPGYGLEPKYYKKVLGKVAKTDIKKGTPLSWKLIKK